MPQKRNAKSIEAERRYRAGEKLVDIAQALGVPDGTVRRWKSDHDWDGKKKRPERSDLKANAIPNARIKNKSTADKSKVPQEGAKTGGDKPNNNAKHPMARPGNKNALGNPGGNGAPLRNKHAVRTHEYVTVFFTVDVVDDEERALINSDYDKYVQQYILIDTLSVREKRILQDIKKLRDDPNGMVRVSAARQTGESTITHTNRNKEGDVWEGQSSQQTSESTNHIAYSSLKRVMELEEALTRVQARKQRAIENLHKMEYDEIRVAIDLSRLQLYKQRLAGAFNLEDLLDDDLIDFEFDA